MSSGGIAPDAPRANAGRVQTLPAARARDHAAVQDRRRAYRDVSRRSTRDARACLTALRRGILAHGFLRARCRSCGKDLLVALSCKKRGVCPSCNARRMCGTAAHLTDHVVPEVPLRQWVLSVPFELRLLLARSCRGARRRVHLGPGHGSRRLLPTANTGPSGCRNAHGQRRDASRVMAPPPWPSQ